MTRSIHIAALGALAAAAAAGPALADAYTFNAYTVPNSVAVTINSTNPSVSGTGLAGAIAISITDNTTNTTSNMTVWCSDISNDLAYPASYTLDTLSSDIGQTGYPYLDAKKVNQVNALLSAAAAGNINVNNAVTSAALSVAIWAVIYDSGDSGYSLTSGNLLITPDGDSSTVGTVTTSGTVLYDANQYLTNITNGTWSANASDTVEQFQPSSVVSPPGTNNQTLVYLGATGQTTGSTPIPEPGSLALLATGLAGFAALRRRRAPARV